ncbi:MAG: methyltransferase domain-containing protein [Pseudodesulfovibrio sp.]
MSSRDYSALLGEFVALNMDLVRAGMPYASVILCHELYRFLYPIEPYADFEHDAPVAHATANIQKLIGVGEAMKGGITPYGNPLNSALDKPEIEKTLHEETGSLYASFWGEFDSETLTEESLQLFKKRVPEEVILSKIKGKNVLDMGCGSGRYSIAALRLGASSVVGIDASSTAYSEAEKYCEANNLPGRFVSSDFLSLPFDDASFDFVFCNGTLHHSASIAQGVSEMFRVLKPNASAFLYLYAAGGIFWDTRNALREVFKNIPVEYTKGVLGMMGMPSNRFIFCDTWYVPVETHTSRQEVETILADAGFGYEKIVSRGEFDLDRALESGIEGAKEMWGDGEHRYLLEK